MEKNLYQLVLGSKSPRRFELLSHLNIPFKTLVNDSPEIITKSSPGEIVMDLALQKVKNTKLKNNEIIIGADTLVFLKDEAIGKPKNKEEAREILLRLSGQKHEVLTGVCIYSNDQHVEFYEKTLVEFSQIDSKLLDDYIDSEESLDKAGAYGIQGMALSFIRRIEGSYSNVVGFPLDLFYKELTAFMHKKTGTKESLHTYFKCN